MNTPINISKFIAATLMACVGLAVHAQSDLAVTTTLSKTRASSGEEVNAAFKITMAQGLRGWRIAFMADGCNAKESGGGSGATVMAPQPLAEAAPGQHVLVKKTFVAAGDQACYVGVKLFAPEAGLAWPAMMAGRTFNSPNSGSAPRESHREVKRANIATRWHGVSRLT